MYVLLIKEDNSARSAITFLFETELGIKVKEAVTVPDGLACLLDDACKFDVVICDDNLGNQKIFKYLMTSEAQIRCLVLKDPKVASVLAYPDLIAGYVNPADVTSDLKKYFADILSASRPEAKEGKDADYCRIRALTAMQKSPLDYDLFVRLSSEKYVRVFKQGSVFTESEVKTFLEKKQIEYLYFSKADAVLFARKLRDEMEKNFNAASATPEGATRSAAAAQEAVLELGNRIGFTPEVQALAKQGMLMTLKTIGTSKPQLANILKGIILQKDKYIGSHAILTAQVACALAHGMSWSSDTTYRKLTFAAFFHDMVLTNNELARIGSVAELERRKSEFTALEFKRYMVHPAGGAQIIETFSEVPPDVNFIIAQHHEKPDGSGFPRGLLGPNITPLSSVFIIAHDLVDYIFENGTKDIEKFFAAYKVKYSSGHFKKIFAQISLGSIGMSDVDLKKPS